MLFRSRESALQPSVQAVPETLLDSPQIAPDMNLEMDGQDGEHGQFQPVDDRLQDAGVASGCDDRMHPRTMPTLQSKPPADSQHLSRSAMVSRAAYQHVPAAHVPPDDKVDAPSKGVIAGSDARTYDCSPAAMLPEVDQPQIGRAHV